MSARSRRTKLGSLSKMRVKLGGEFGRGIWHKHGMNRHDSVRPDFTHVTDWVFDLDNTLYPRECNLFAQIDLLISTYMVDVTGLPYPDARALQKAYYRDHGTTLHGLMLHHQVDPDHFLKTVHAIDYSGVPAHPDLAEAIGRLPGRKFILTNGDVGHTNAVLKRVGAADLFERRVLRGAWRRCEARGDVRRSRKEPRGAARSGHENRADRGR